MLMKVNIDKPKELNTSHSCYVSMPQKIYQEMFEYITAFDTECSGCGLIEMIPHEQSQTEFRVKELYFPNQSNTCSTTDIEDKEIAKIITNLVQQNRNPEELRFHWHSHAQMDVFHSGTDEENYEDLKTGDWLVSIVANHKKEIYARVDYYKPFRLSISGIPVYVQTPDTEIDKTRINENIERVKKSDKPEYDYSKMSYPEKYTNNSNDSLTNFFNALIIGDWHNENLLMNTSGSIYGYIDPLTGKYYEITATEISQWEIEQGGIY